MNRVSLTWARFSWPTFWFLTLILPWYDSGSESVFAEAIGDKSWLFPIVLLTGILSILALIDPNWRRHALAGPLVITGLCWLFLRPLQLVYADLIGC